MLRALLAALVLVLVVAFATVYWIGAGGLGTYWGAGTPAPVAIDSRTIEARAAEQRAAADSAGVLRAKQILFGDLHVHSTFSLDAFMMALPTGGGEGAHPVADACDFARHCSALDFWSINDHAVALTQDDWTETIASIRQCNEIAGDPENPDVSAFLGWEWTQMGTQPDNHYGHKNVVVRGLSDEEIPTRPIAAAMPADAWDRQPDAVAPGTFMLGLLGVFEPDQDTWDLLRYFDRMINLKSCPQDVPVRELPLDCREDTLTPEGLFAKLDDWGFDSVVIPHGTTWGFYTPHGSAWDKQLRGKLHDPKRQTLIEVFSGHGNSEEFRDWREIAFAEDGSQICPEPRDDFLPSCWRAGEIIEERCLAAGESAAECSSRAADARENYMDGGIMGHLTVPGVTPAEWLDSDQCRDCFQPSFNYRPRSSAQYIMALRNFDDPDNPKRFEFGFMASSDNHTARPGTGFKEFGRVYNTEARLAAAGNRIFSNAMPVKPREPEPRSLPFSPDLGGAFFNLRESERASSFFLTGGLIAVHSDGRSRDDVWDAMQRKEVYGTSGPRMLLWFDLLNPPGNHKRPLPMGSSTAMKTDPIFRVRAVGSLAQKPGCPDASRAALGDEDLERLCRGDCYNPSDERRLISRIEIVRIQPQNHPDEPVEGLIQDPWRVFRCDGDPAGCTATFSDSEFAAGGRDNLYYARVIEETSMAVNADLARCEKDERGRCLAVNLCGSDVADTDDCLAETEERAWSSPIFVAQRR